MAMMPTHAGEYLNVGDYISLYSVETEGYIYSTESSTAHNGLYIYREQDRDKPSGIPDPQAVVFKICIQNRYKLNKKYRKWLTSAGGVIPESEEQKAVMGQAKLASEAENADNAAEQKRQQGKRVRYGEIVQLKHSLTAKYIHMCTSQTSQRDKNNMMVTLQDYNAKNAQFRILPQYKVKSEGEVVQIYDQIVFESIKSPGHYFHASQPWQVDHFTFGSEVNLGVERSGFTLVRFCKDVPEWDHFVKGGCVIRLFHKELEAYLVAEGLFDEQVTEDVHFRIRVMDQHKPRTLSPPTSGNTFWQIEAESGVLNGDVLRWEQQIRLRHMPTRKYLCIDANKELSLANDNEDPRTVFRMHSVLSEHDEIRFESYARIEHVLTGFWLHALKDEDYIRKQFRSGADDQTLQGLQWDGAPVRQVAASGECAYDDAFTIQFVEQEFIDNFNYVAGMVPFLLNLIEDRKQGQILNARKTHSVLTAMDELRRFMMILGTTVKKRQKLMRNLRVIDLLVHLLKCPLDKAPDEANLVLVFKEAYEILYTYMCGKSRKNALYFAKYIEFFQTQFTQKGGIGINVAQMIVELIRDKRKIVDRVTHSQIDQFVTLLRENQNYRFLDLLQVLCVCDDVAIPNNQTYIVQQWLQDERHGVYMTARGQDINRQPNILYISTDIAQSWFALHDFVNETSNHFSRDKYDFLIHQLDLYKALCFGRNDYAINAITKELRYLTWEETFLCLRSDILPDVIRAKYCDLTTSLFVDVGNNYSVLDHPNICFVYDYVGSKDEEKSQGDFVVKELVAIFPVLRDWIAEFLSMNTCMIACDVGHNMLIEQVLRLLYHLVQFGYYLDADDVRILLPFLLNLLDGRHDFPFPRDREKGYSKEAMKKVQEYVALRRFEICLETEAIVNAKNQALEVLDLLLTYQRNMRLQVALKQLGEHTHNEEPYAIMQRGPMKKPQKLYHKPKPDPKKSRDRERSPQSHGSFVAKFKTAEQSAAIRKSNNTLIELLYETFNPHDQSKRGSKKQKQVNRELRDMFLLSSIFDNESITKVLLDLSSYKYNKLVTKSLDILNKLYSSKTNMFKLSAKVQVLLTQDSARVHREVLKSMPILRRLARAKLDDQQVKLMGTILDDLAEFCHLPMTPDEPHPMNQNILISNGILNIMFDVLVQDIDTKLLEQYSGMRDIFKKTFYLLKLLARENDTVQNHIYDRLDILLDVRVVESDLAVALKEVFMGNANTCLKIHPRQIQKIVNRVADMQEQAPEFLDLLSMIVKVVGTGLTLKRNQAYVMKYIMQNYKKVAHILDQPRDVREVILTDPTKMSTLRYYISLLDLLATCAEGENMFIESLCQTILPLDDLLWVLNNPKVDNVLKKPFVRCVHHVYMRSNGSVIETGSGELPHDDDLWTYLSYVSVSMNRLTDSVKEDPEKIAIHLRTAPEKSGAANAPDFESSAYGTCLYFIESVMPFLEVFYREFYFPDITTYPDEIDETDHIAKAVVLFSEVVGPLLYKPEHMKHMVNCLTSIVPASNMPNSNLESILERFASGITVEDTSSAIRRGNIEYYSEEIELNAKFRTFALSCSLVFGGHNTVSAQLKCKSKREYTILGGDEELPLGEEFQSHVRCFTQAQEKKAAKRFEIAAKLIEQLWIATKPPRLSEAKRQELDDLNVKCLQLLRAIIHNEERRLPVDWELRTHEIKITKQMKFLTDIQNYFNSKRSLNNSLPHLASRSDDMVREVLAFISIMLFNANHTVQSSMLDYFLSTREEVFFMAVRDRMQMSTNSIKERRSLQAQKQARIADASRSESRKSSYSAQVSRLALRQIQGYEDILRQQRLSGWTNRKFNESLTQGKPRKKRKKKVHKGGKKVGNCDIKANGTLEKDPKALAKKEVTFVNKAMDEDESLIQAQEGELETVTVEEPPQDDAAERERGSVAEYRDDGYIQLVLKVMARMCDGQYLPLQNYLREQPDNIKSFNIIAEVSRFLEVIYSNINGRTVDLVIQLFETMNEFTAGNQENRCVIYDNKIIDYINFIQRAGEFADCPIEKVLILRQSIANLIISLIEENGPGPSLVAMEVKDTLDKKAVYQLMAECFEVHNPDKRKLEQINMVGLPEHKYLKGAKTFARFGDSFVQKFMHNTPDENAEEYMDVGFTMFLIIARMYDIDPKLGNRLVITFMQQKAFEFYKKNCMSIEVVKDDYLQKINFRVKNKRVLREEVKEKLKWSVDRSSPSNKIRDLMEWTRDIMKDIAYQKKILSNPIAICLTKGWLVWNHAVTLLSFAINILMLVTWNASAALPVKPSDNTTDLPFGIDDPVPVIDKLSADEYRMTIYILGGTHNLLSVFVLISYFVCNHPSFPNVREFLNNIRKPFRKRDETEVEQERRKPHISKLDARFFSFTTLFYLIFVALSVAGTFYHGYFFAFHLLNIVNNNQLLSGVIRAVTQNGKSLLWVAVLGLVVFYLYGIVGFALMRSMFNPTEYLYCDSLWQCTITVIRYGLIGDLFEVMKAHPTEATFTKFGFMVLYHVSFFIFITTIGLNIIFGIIVDTFSELRDLKWTAESDMRDTCFVCSRNSYDFEHHGKGFDHHVRHEHNMWAYIFFFIHLNGTKVNDYNAIEMFVYKSLNLENYDFFPLDRALSLAAMGKDSTDSKLDDLIAQVTFIVEKQRREEGEKKRREEKMRQKIWEQKHRLGSFRRRARLPGPRDADPVGSMSPAHADDPRMLSITQQLRRASEAVGQQSQPGAATSREGRSRHSLSPMASLAEPGTQTPGAGSVMHAPIQHQLSLREPEEGLLRSMSPVRYEDSFSRGRTPSASRRGSMLGDMLSMSPSHMAGEFPSRDYGPAPGQGSGLLSPSWLESRTTTPRASIFFPDGSESRDHSPHSDRRLSAAGLGSYSLHESVDVPGYTPDQDIPTREHDPDYDAGSDFGHHSEPRS